VWNRWRWYYYIAMYVTIPIGLFLAFYYSRIRAASEKCESFKLKRLHAAVHALAIADSHDVARNILHRRIAIVSPLALTVLCTAIGFMAQREVEQSAQHAPPTMLEATTTVPPSISSGEATEHGNSCGWRRVSQP